MTVDWVPVIVGASAVIAAFFGRHVGRAALRSAVSADWSSYTDKLSERLDVVEKRLDASEMRAAAAELRATTAERLYGVARDYLRRINVWAKHHRPHIELPLPPAELEADL